MPSICLSSSGSGNGGEHRSSPSPVHPNRLTLYSGRLTTRLGMRVRLHDLRHAFASLLLAESVPVLDVSRILGHASAAFTMDRYGHLMPRHADGIRAAIGRAYAGEALPVQLS